jgi:hypothetical protein
MSEADSGTPATTEPVLEGEQQQIASEPTEQPAATPVQERIVSNEEAMIAQVLSRIKKQAKQLERTSKVVEQVLDSLKKADKERVKHSRQVEQQNKKVLSQIAQLQKRIAKAKTSPPKRKAAANKKKKAKTRPKRR